MTSYTVFTLMILFLSTSSVTPRRVVRQVNGVNPYTVNPQQPPSPYYPYAYPPSPYPHAYPPPPPPQPSYYYPPPSYYYPPPPQTGYPAPPQTGYPAPTQTYYPAPAQTYYPAPAQTYNPAPTQTYYPAPTQNLYPPPTGTGYPTTSTSTSYNNPSGTPTTTSVICSDGIVVKNDDDTSSCVQKLRNGTTRVQNMQRSNEVSIVYPATCINHKLSQKVDVVSPTASTEYVPTGKAC